MAVTDNFLPLEAFMEKSFLRNCPPEDVRTLLEKLNAKSIAHGSRNHRKILYDAAVANDLHILWAKKPQHFTNPAWLRRLLTWPVAQLLREASSL